MAVFSLQTDPGVAKPQPACSSAQCQGPSLSLLHAKWGQDLVLPSTMFSKAVPQHAAPDVYHCLMLFFQNPSQSTSHARANFLLHFRASHKEQQHLEGS